MKLGRLKEILNLVTDDDLDVQFRAETSPFARQIDLDKVVLYDGVVMFEGDQT